MPYEPKTPRRIAVLDTSYYILHLWLTPNMFGEVSCSTKTQAEKIIGQTGVPQRLEVVGGGR